MIVSCSAQIPVAVEDDEISISGMWPWWTVMASCSVGCRKARNSSAPATTSPPGRGVHDHVVGEDLAHARPVLGVHRPEVAGLQLLDRLDVVHVLPFAQIEVFQTEPSLRAGGYSRSLAVRLFERFPVLRDAKGYRPVMATHNALSTYPPDSCSIRT